MKNIYLQNRPLIAAICKQNSTPEHSITYDVGASMLAADMRSGQSLYFPEYPEGLREQWGKLTGIELAQMSQEFSDKYWEDFRSGHVWVD